MLAKVSFCLLDEIEIRIGWILHISVFQIESLIRQQTEKLRGLGRRCVRCV